MNNEFYCSLLELDLRPVTGDYMRLTDAAYDVTYEGHLYRAFGSLLKIDKITAENTLASRELGISLSGVAVDFQESVNSNIFRRAPIRIIKAFVPDSSNVVQDARIYYRGFTSTPETDVNYQDGVMALKISCKSIFDLDQEPSLMRSNNATHQAFHSGDKFFQYATIDQNNDVMWKQ
ncbi:hypothetical protein ACJ7VZ_05415 [Aeromonas salmonicida]|uniref:baseplate hub domain-containing protein n=1 Tax=Aeromonas salmonicida TaxID=645 RepID=UPI0038BA8E22